MELFDILWPKTPVQCNGVCQSQDFINTQDVKRSGELGCPKCLLLYKSMHQYFTEDDLIRFVPHSAGITSFAYKLNSFRVFRRSRLFYLCGTPKPTWDFIKPGNLFLDSRREGHQSLLTGWINNCNSNHKDCTVPDSILPKRVLDVGTETAKRLLLHISSGEVASYVALSHCWGPNGILLKTTTSTIKDHQQAISFQDLPMNFQDAVTVTRSIGIRYLWIDSLCIVQDDTTDWQVESSKMSSIYRDAYLVLAATQATDSCQGFLDRKDATDYVGKRFHYTQPSVKNNPVQTGLIRNPNSTVSRIYIQDLGYSGTEQRHHDTVTYSPLNRRAWVLQENILPRRVVHFTCNEILWECIECLKCECMEIDETPVQEKTVNLMRDAHFFNFSNYYYDSLVTLHRSWLDLLEAYWGLALSHESDRLPALSGLASLWRSRGSGVYLAGLWKDNILNSIMWKANDIRPIKCWKAYRAPSWSPFALGYTMDDRKPVSAKCNFPTDYRRISKEYAKVVDASCTPDGKDEMGAVKDGYLLLRTLVTEVYPEGTISITSIASDSEWDRGIEDAGGREVTLILIGYHEFSTDEDGEDWVELSPRAMITIPSKRTAGAYERIGMFMPHAGEQAERIDQCFRDAEEREIKIV